MNIPVSCITLHYQCHQQHAVAHFINDILLDIMNSERIYQHGDTNLYTHQADMILTTCHFDE